MAQSDTNTFDLDLEFGQNWEEAFSDIVGKHLVEAKCDRIAHETGNIFIEYQYKGKPSGIATTDAEFWVIGIADQQGHVARALLASTKWLKAQCTLLWLEPKHNVRGGHRGQSQGILVPIDAWGQQVQET